MAHPPGVLNKINLNVYVTDIPLWYKPAIGPAVEMQISYNSRAAIATASPFGKKWTLNIGSSLSENTSSGAAAITMPDGRKDVYTTGGYVPMAIGQVYARPLGIFNSLSKIDANHFELTFLDGTVYTYKIPTGTSLTSPCLVEINDAYGQKLNIGYNSSNRLETVTDATGRVTTLQYDANGQVQTITDPFNRIVTFAYTNGNLTSVKDMAGYQTGYTYDASSYIQSIITKSIDGTQVNTWGFLIEPSDSQVNPYP